VKLLFGRANAAFSFGSILTGVLGVISLIWLHQFPYRLSQPESISFKQTFFCAATLLIGSFACGLIAFRLTWRKSSFMSKIGALGGVSISTLGLSALCLDFGAVGVHSMPSALNVCINNQRMINGAKEVWKMRVGAQIGTAIDWNEIASEFSRALPQCPSGGKYDLGKVGESVACSIAEHQAVMR